MLVPFSRLYLGVHTPLDVAVSIGIALILIFGLYPIIKNCFEKTNVIRIILMVMFLLSLGLLAFVLLYEFPVDVDAENLASGTKNAFKMAGCTLGILISFEIDERFIKFDTSATWPAQIIKFVVGLIPLLAIKEGLKAPLNALFDGNYIADGLRYLLLVLFVGSVWPLTFKWFSKLFRK